MRPSANGLTQQRMLPELYQGKEGKSMGIATTVTTINPNKASLWLAKSDGNRTISNSTVEKYASDMRNGNWVLNGEAIIFDKNGVLRDGHHRLYAVIKSGATVQSLVVSGIDPDDCTVIDMGRARTVRDTMIINGIDSWKTNTSIHGCARVYFRLVRKVFAPSYNEVIDFINDNETELNAIYEHLHLGGGNQKTYFSKRAPIIFAILSAIKYGIEENKLWSFMDSLNSGIIDNKNESSVIKLRNMLILKTIDSCASKQVDMVYAAENAIRDYVNNTPRKKEYKNCKSVYSSKVWAISEEE